MVARVRAAAAVKLKQVVRVLEVFWVIPLLGFLAASYASAFFADEIAFKEEVLA